MYAVCLLLAAAVVSNCVPNASFEAGIAPHGVIVSGAFCDEAARPVVALDDSTAAHGKCSLKIDAARGGSYEFLTPDIDLPTNSVKVTISAFAKADRPAEFRLGAFGYDKDPETDKGLFTCPGRIVKVGQAWERVVLERVVVDSRCSRLSVKIMGDGPVVLWLDGIQFDMDGGDGMSFSPMSDVEAVWTAEDSVFARAADEVSSGVAEISLVDYATGEVKRRRKSFPLDRNGLFSLSRSFTYNGRVVQPFPFDYAVVPSVAPYQGGGFALGGNGLTGISVNRKTGETGIQVGWLASQADMAASDWRIVE